MSQTTFCWEIVLLAGDVKDGKLPLENLDRRAFEMSTEDPPPAVGDRFVMPWQWQGSRGEATFEVTESQMCMSRGHPTNSSYRWFRHVWAKVVRIDHE